MNKIPKDIIILPEFTDNWEGRWVIMNVFARTCLGVESSVLEFLANVENLPLSDILSKYKDTTFHIWNIERFSNADGLLADPTRYERDCTAWGEPLKADLGSLITVLTRHFILIQDERKYAERFKLKRTILDREHFGNFHQQLGQYLLLVERESPTKAWLDQKFTKDLKAVRTDNLYGSVQAHFLKRYFDRKIIPGNKVVDIGCGTGFYSHMMTKAGADVLGIDPNQEFITLAREEVKGQARFEVMNVGTEGALSNIPDQYADVVFMSDALLFYFVPVHPDQKADIQVLFRDIWRILKDNGTFVSVEPHYIFWLMPWLGSIDRPFTIITEYVHKVFGVTATFGRLIQSFTQNGFAVTHMEEMVPDPAFKEIDPRAYYFANEFPVWQLFELKKTSSL
jgi:SAM-dependent methyltransferase